MSDPTLKASLKQTLAYINAYDVELLRAIETDFRAALQRIHGEDENEDTPHVTEAEDSLTPEMTPPPPAPSPTRPVQQSPQAKTPAYQLELITLPNWHFQLPFVIGIVATILLFIAR
tara:strand:+ start:145 stop:495 length:351 start_codon:yes stop_codon:yes gene_type:complete